MMGLRKDERHALRKLVRFMRTMGEVITERERFSLTLAERRVLDAEMRKRGFRLDDKLSAWYA